jgi:hypothetical protein
MTTGGCFCGAIRYEVRGKLTSVTYCHCSKCRKWHGHVGAYTAADRSDFTLTESRGLKWHAVSESVRRGFCGECGSTVLFDEAQSPKMSLTPGTLDAPTGTFEKAHIFVGSKGDYYDIAGALPKYDTLP